MKANRIRGIGVGLAACVSMAGAPALAQVSSLTLSSAIAGPGSSASLALSMNAGGTLPAGLQWTLVYPTSQISGIAVTPGAAAAGETLSCGATRGSFTCMLEGANDNMMASGVIANVQVTLAPTATTTAINITNPVAVTAAGSGLPVLSSLAGGVVVPAISSVTCAPASLNPGQSSNCSITLNMAAPAGGTAISPASNNPLLTVPASVLVPVGTSSAAFSATASSSVPANQNATVTATLGSSQQTATIGLVAPVVVSSVTCNATGVMSGGSTICSVTLSQAVSANTSVSLNSSSTLLSIPADITIAAGTAAGNATAIAATVLLNTQAVVSATFGASSQSATVLLWPMPTLTSLTCAPVKIAVGATSSCTVAMSNAAGSLAIGISSSNTALVGPASVTVLEGASSAGFTVTAQAVAAHSIVLKASWNGASQSQSFGIMAAPQMQSISCEPGRARRRCRVTFEASHDSAPMDLSLASSNQSIKVPANVSVQPGQSSVRFQIDAVPPIGDHATTITAQLGADVVQEAVSLESLPGPLNVPIHVYVKFGEEIQFRVSASDPAATLAAWDLPAGAVFDAASGVFEWVPDVSSGGTHTVVFTEVGPGAGSVTATSIVEVGPNSPVVTRVVNAASRSEAAACSPGAIASLKGRWLAEGEAAEDRSGHSTALAGTVVRVNGVAAPILSASASQVDFLCPAAVPGTGLDIALHTSSGFAPTIRTISMDAAPGIFSVDTSGTGQGLVMHAGTAIMVMIPNYRYSSREALPDDLVTIYATGIAMGPEVAVMAGGVEVVPQSIVAMPELAGIYQVSVRLPAGPADGDMPVSLKVTRPDGSVVTSNTVQVATRGFKE